MLKLVRIKMNSKYGSQGTESGFPLPSDTITAMDDNDNRIIMFPRDFYQKNEIENGWKVENYGYVTDCIIFGPNQAPYMFPVPVKDLEIMGDLDLVPVAPQTEPKTIRQKAGEQIIGFDIGEEDRAEVITMLKSGKDNIMVGREVWDKMEKENDFKNDLIMAMVKATEGMKRNV